MASAKPSYRENRKQRRTRQAREALESDDNELTHSEKYPPEKYRGKEPSIYDPGAYEALRVRTLSDMTEAERANLESLYGKICDCVKCEAFREAGKGTKAVKRSQPELDAPEEIDYDE